MSVQISGAPLYVSQGPKNEKSETVNTFFFLNNRKQLVKNVAHYGVMVPFPAAMELED